jgi:cyclopropane fatty-acyl-phospholipid synthase-like methyltransferase
MKEKWKKYWQDKSDPLHRANTANHYRSYASELRVLFNDLTPHSVLELGCGNGAFYEYLRFDKAHVYKGVDFSPSMIDFFKKAHRAVDLECLDAAAYRDDNKYDLIFSNGLVQYFDQQMLSKHFVNAKSMMQETSLFICGSVLWKTQRFKYLSGELIKGRKRSIVKGFIGYVRRVVFNDPMGIWYNPSDIEALALKNEMTCEFYASMHYLSRFHAVMKLR